jgi:protoporphyrinogen oxidase
MPVQNQPESIAVIGGGITGISAALRLAKAGRFRVTLIEKEGYIGGLDSFYEWRDLACDRFYHVVLPTDGRMLLFLEELGLSSRLHWRKVRSGFFGRGRFVPLSSVRDFLCFPFLTPGRKIRLGLGILYIARFKKLAGLDGVYSPQWLTRVFGRSTYERVWEPLLRSKLGEAADRTSAAFMWATIRRLYGARGTGAKQEKMGYWRGGYRSLIGRAQKALVESGVSIVTGHPVKKIEYDPEAARLNTRQPGSLTVVTNGNRMRYDRILLTIPCPQALKLINTEGGGPYLSVLRDVEYLGVLSILLILKRALSPYYVINLLDRGFPFTGIVETTNIISPEEMGGRHLVYLPKYITSDDPLNRLADDQVAHLFIDKLRSVFPDLRPNDILHLKVFREPFVQPIPSLHFLSRPISPLTPLPHVYLANTAMIPDSLHNNNANINLAEKVAAMISIRP